MNAKLRINGIGLPLCDMIKYAPSSFVFCLLKYNLWESMVEVPIMRTIYLYQIIQLVKEYNKYYIVF